MSRYGIKPRIGSLPSNDLLRRCTSLFAIQNGEGSPFDLVSRLSLSNATGTTTFAAYPVGNALQTTGSNASRWANATESHKTTSTSILWWGNLEGASSSSASLGGVTHNSSNTSPFVAYEIKRNSTANNLYLSYNLSAGASTNLLSPGAYVTGVVAVVATVRSGYQSLAINGSLVASSTNTGTTVYGTNPRMEIGDSLNARSPAAACWMMATWGRSLSDSEAVIISADPMILLRTFPHRTYSIPSGSSAKPWLYTPSTSVVYGYAAGAA